MVRITRLITNGIKVYKIFVSPYFISSCRYFPSCSDYAVEALEKGGILKGAFLSLWRILRCNPFSKGGIDYLMVGTKGEK